jgi:hypothetical protein
MKRYRPGPMRKAVPRIIAHATDTIGPARYALAFTACNRNFNWVSGPIGISS